MKIYPHVNNYDNSRGDLQKKGLQSANFPPDLKVILKKRVMSAAPVRFLIQKRCCTGSPLYCFFLIN